jgi:hypothetical protein
MRRTAAAGILFVEDDVDDRLLAEMAHRDSGVVNRLEFVSDGDETMAYRPPLLQPMLEVAIASAGPENAHCPYVRFAEAELAVLVAATDPAAVRLKATDLMPAATAAGVQVWCGYASPATEASAIKVIAAASAVLAFTRRIGPGTAIG